jgi:hypothetical protein
MKDLQHKIEWKVLIENIFITKLQNKKFHKVRCVGSRRKTLLEKSSFILLTSQLSLLVLSLNINSCLQRRKQDFLFNASKSNGIYSCVGSTGLCARSILIRTLVQKCLRMRTILLSDLKKRRTILQDLSLTFGIKKWILSELKTRVTKCHTVNCWKTLVNATPHGHHDESLGVKLSWFSYCRYQRSHGIDGHKLKFDDLSKSKWIKKNWMRLKKITMMSDVRSERKMKIIRKYFFKKIKWTCLSFFTGKKIYSLRISSDRLSLWCSARYSFKTFYVQHLRDSPFT